MTELHASSQPLISFIITDYNLPVALLKECLDSILAICLDDEEREIIVVDDGSDVSPWEELETYHDSVVYLRQDNKGLSEARNLGLEHARGRYVQFVDGDDCLIKSGYDHIAKKLRKPDTYFNIDMIMFKMARIRHPRRGVASLLDLFWYLSSKEYLTKKNLHASACGYVFCRALLGDLRFTPGIYHEDEEFTPRLVARVNYVLFTSMCAYYYRQREDSITNDMSREHIERRMHDFADIILRLRQESTTKEGEALPRRTHQLTMDYVYNAIKAANDYEHFCHCVAPLLDNRLLPLPLHRYTTKYFLFALLTRFDMGRKVLYDILKK